jgi:hypothetical protein
MGGAALGAALAYSALVFAAGFVLGTLRVLVLAPLLGEPAAVLLEVPVMLVVSWAVCARLTRRFAVPAAASARLGMGGVALLVLLAAELVLSALAFGRAPATFVSGLARPAGAVGFAGQMLFALIPWLQSMRRT